MAIGLAASADAMGAFSPRGMSLMRAIALNPRPAQRQEKITPRVAPPRHPWQRAGEFAMRRMQTLGG